MHHQAERDTHTHMCIQGAGMHTQSSCRQTISTPLLSRARAGPSLLASPAGPPVRRRLGNTGQMHKLFTLAVRQVSQLPGSWFR